MMTPSMKSAKVYANHILLPTKFPSDELEQTARIRTSGCAEALGSLPLWLPLRDDLKLRTRVVSL
ncbi:hypothetical protein EV356DRAFT_503677, partial [Viridothelium virens]